MLQLEATVIEVSTVQISVRSWMFVAECLLKAICGYVQIRPHYSKVNKSSKDYLSSAEVI